MPLLNVGSNGRKPNDGPQANWVTAASRLIYSTGLRKTRVGRRLIVSLNTVANRIGHLLYLHDRKLVEAHGHKMLLGDRNIPSLAFLSNCVNGLYEPHTTALMNSLIKEGMTVFDVGAHVGYYTLLAAKRVGVTGHVYAFEPEPENFGLLVKNVDSNNHRNVTCINMAVSDTSGLVTFYANHEGNDLHSVINHSNDRRSTRIQVRTISVDNFISSAGIQRVDLVKMDIEGAEALAVAGMSKLLAQSGPLLIILEFAPQLIRNARKHPVCVLQSLLDKGLRVLPIEGAVSGQIVTQKDLQAVVLEAERRGAINLLCSNTVSDLL